MPVATTKNWIPTYRVWGKKEETLMTREEYLAFKKGKKAVYDNGPYGGRWKLEGGDTVLVTVSFSPADERKE